MEARHRHRAERGRLRSTPLVMHGWTRLASVLSGALTLNDPGSPLGQRADAEVRRSHDSERAGQVHAVHGKCMCNVVGLEGTRVTTQA